MEETPKEKLEILKEFEWNKIGSYSNMNPFTIVFCYPMNGKHYVVKGGANDVQKYLKQIKIPTFTNTTFWKHGESRNHWEFEGEGTANLRVSHLYQYRYSKPKGWKIYTWNKNEELLIATYRTLPQKFPKKVKQFIKLSKKTLIERIVESFK